MAAMTEMRDLVCNHGLKHLARKETNPPVELEHFPIDATTQTRTVLTDFQTLVDDSQATRQDGSRQSRLLQDTPAHPIDETLPRVRIRNQQRFPIDDRFPDARAPQDERPS